MAFSSLAIWRRPSDSCSNDGVRSRLAKASTDEREARLYAALLRWSMNLALAIFRRKALAFLSEVYVNLAVRAQR